jgi:integrase
VEDVSFDDVGPAQEIARVRGVLALTWKDVSFDRGAISITKSLEEVDGILAIKAAKSEGSNRTVKLSAFTIEALQTHRKAMLAEGSYQADGPVFCGKRNKTWLRKSDVHHHSFQKILKAAGLTFRFHDLRHCCASFLLMAGESVKTVQERLGHSTPTMTLNTDSHILEGAQAEAAKKLGAILAAAMPPVKKGETA